MTEDAPQALPATVLDALAREFPGARAERATVAGRGWDVTAWRVPTNDGDWLVRVPRHAGAIAAIEDQTCLMSNLGPLGFPVPRDARLLRDAHEQVIAGLYRYVEGHPAQVRGPTERERLAAGLGAFLTRLHGLDPATLLGCRVQRYEPWRDEFAPRLEHCLPHLGGATRTWIEGRAAALAALSRALPPPVLLHADLKPAHVLLDEAGEVAGILDFESVPVSDPAFDFSRVMKHWDRGLAVRVLAHYDRPVDTTLLKRAEAYVDFDAVASLDSALRRPDMPEMVARSKRVLAARAAAATRQRRIDAP